MSDTIYEFTTDLDSYQISEEIYTGRHSRLLYGGKNQTAQSGIPLDGNNSMLFEYNQRFVELIDQLKPKTILVVGGGVYTLPTYIINHYPNTHVDVVEPDKELDKIAIKYFNLSASARLKIWHDFGLSFLKKNNSKYDLIIVDAYYDQHIPIDITTKKFSKLAADHLTDNGVLAMNIISDLKADSVMHKIHGNYRKVFKFFQLFPVSRDRFYVYPSNLVYVASLRPLDMELEYPELNDLR